MGVNLFIKAKQKLVLFEGLLQLFELYDATILSEVDVIAENCIHSS